MNILTSYQWIKEYLATDLSAEEFAKRTTAVGNSVERLEHLVEKFDHLVVGIVKEIRPHPDADKLQIVRVDIGKEEVEIVCGGVNLKDGIRVVVGLPGARVRWHGQGELMELKKTKIRGVESFGMICAAEEIGFEKLPAGEADIWDITSLTSAQAGTSIVQALDLDDVIFDIEVTTNRPDCKSILGQARDGAAALGQTWTAPTFVHSQNKSGREHSPFDITVKNPELCPNYSAVLIEGVKVGPSPWWLQKKLLLAGMRPINNVVDVTNYVLHEYGQPLHAFDADTLEGPQIIVRNAKTQEQFLALDGKTYELDERMLVIADAKKPVAIAGVMGGEHTGSTEATTRVLLECATFDPVSVRKTARALNVYSDAQLLFEKGLSSEATGPAMARAIELLCDLTGGTCRSDVMVKQVKPYEPRVFPFDPSAANRLMGIELKEKEMVDILARLGFQSTPLKHSGYSVTVPYWRDHDIEHSVDFVEEIARMYGYDKFPAQLPSGELKLVSPDVGLAWERTIKHILAGAGFTEAYSFAFVSEQELTQYGLTPDQAVKLKNPLSVEHAFLRPSLVPTLLSGIEQNQKRFSQHLLFELAPVYLPKKHDRPDEPLELVMACYGKDGHEQFLKGKGALERFFTETGVTTWSLSRESVDACWHPGRTAALWVDGKRVGTIGQVSHQIAQAFGLDVEVVLVQLRLSDILPSLHRIKTYAPLPVFPSIKRDLAFVVEERVEYASLVERLEQCSDFLESVELFDVYRGKGIDEGKKSLALHFTFRSLERTLESREADEALTAMRSMLEKEFGAIMRS